MNDKKNLLLDKLIALTKEHKLGWEVYDQSDLRLNPEKPSFFNNKLSTVFMAQSSTPSYSRSYITRYNNGYIGLFAYTYMSLSSHVELVLQANDYSMPATVVTSNSDDAEISSKVKRLYNLIDLDSDKTDVSAYIDEILNN